MYKSYFVIKKENNLKIVNQNEINMSKGSKIYRVAFPDTFSKDEVLSGSEILIRFNVAQLIKN
ncbi:hypothetical protein [Clostridium thermobutyricum]|uniref:hypothetical protein n=1 Tax=Clostridium thermobutyricum TaxID=29372 RepID=UPI0018AA847E|nr:hypothetical protein [Clostridium thermobutyricum]